MLKKLTFFEGSRYNPFFNLAVEETLMLQCGAGECVLYLWQNEKTVVIGRNQDPWRECRVETLEAEGGNLARRKSGGGAVYHDLGNLNFSFLFRQEDYDVKRQLEVIRLALKQLGVEAECSGRNDLTVQDRKISGSAFYERGDLCCHHGTLMLDVDTEALERYLTVSPAKLETKGVASVRSRVGNLREWLPELRTGDLKDALRWAFEDVYELKSEPLPVEALDARDLAERERWFAAPKWRYGRRLGASHTLSRRFSWGEFRLELRVSSGRIIDAEVYSDALYLGGLEILPQSLIGAAFEKETLRRAVELCPAWGEIERKMRTDILAWFVEEGVLDGETI